jgi:hypothetical protein
MTSKHQLFDESGQVLFFSRIAEEDKDGLQITVEEALQQIQIGSVVINKARQSKSILYDEIKIKKLPGVMWNKSGRYAYFDFDFKPGNSDHNPELSNSELEFLKSKLITTGYVYACWISLSKTGIGCLVCYQNTVNSELEWKNLYQNIQNKLNEYTGFVTDRHCNSIVRKNVLSHDPNMLINPDVTPFDSLYDLLNDWGVQSYNITNNKKTYIATKCTPIVPDNMRMFHRQSFLDIHFNHHLEEAIYVNEEVGYAVFEERKTKIKIYTPQKKKFGSGRKVTLFYALLTRYFLNPNYKHLKLFQWLRDFNQSFCVPPLSDNDLQSIWDYVMISIKSDKFVIKGNSDCYVHFFSYCELTQKQKKSITSQSRILRTKHSIKKAINQLISNDKSLTKHNVAELSNVKPRTVAKYWTEFLPVSNRLNIEEHKRKYYQKDCTEADYVVSNELNLEILEWLISGSIPSNEQRIVTPGEIFIDIEPVSDEELEELVCLTKELQELTPV